MHYKFGMKYLGSLVYILITAMSLGCMTNNGIDETSDLAEEVSTCPEVGYETVYRFPIKFDESQLGQPMLELANFHYDLASFINSPESDKPGCESKDPTADPFIKITPCDLTDSITQVPSLIEITRDMNSQTKEDQIGPEGYKLGRDGTLSLITTSYKSGPNGAIGEITHSVYPQGKTPWSNLEDPFYKRIHLLDENGDGKADEASFTAQLFSKNGCIASESVSKNTFTFPNEENGFTASDYTLTTKHQQHCEEEVPTPNCPVAAQF